MMGMKLLQLLLVLLVLSMIIAVPTQVMSQEEEIDISKLPWQPKNPGATTQWILEKLLGIEMGFCVVGFSVSAVYSYGGWYWWCNPIVKVKRLYTDGYAKFIVEIIPRKMVISFGWWRWEWTYPFNFGIELLIRYRPYALQSVGWMFRIENSRRSTHKVYVHYAWSPVHPSEIKLRGITIPLVDVPVFGDCVSPGESKLSGLLYYGWLPRTIGLITPYIKKSISIYLLKKYGVMTLSTPLINIYIKCEAGGFHITKKVVVEFTIKPVRSISPKELLRWLEGKEAKVEKVSTVPTRVDNLDGGYRVTYQITNTDNKPKKVEIRHKYEYRTRSGTTKVKEEKKTVSVPSKRSTTVKIITTRKKVFWMFGITDNLYTRLMGIKYKIKPTTITEIGDNYVVLKTVVEEEYGITFEQVLLIILITAIILSVLSISKRFKLFKYKYLKKVKV